ncbi:glycogen debranching enzyme isoform 1 (agl) related protein [Thermoplasma acidophilum]|uniref:Glycogen debranching enzyme isoform 1 (Agl) related protein n=1 Tax=Thermoplasma acidophilum (strain ATCC 25905 / DSM 1728 / JCM 9062 / NBRC 15155 / AMRC-C165) TaxID=273075 RepID=Q9HL89_THEAC|nr:amylo-alpha-1,6-glucosidase [Thermoplasma acidophilum]CAC11485.1 glycogen debranching enzyme isoform 1 (agl) related protein [Thermoplasma acidophilum]
MDLNSEWIISNSNGSYASSTVSFANTRTYHGILVRRDPSKNSATVLLSKIFEEVRYGDAIFSIDTNYYRDSVFPDGFKFIMAYADIPVPKWSFSFGKDRTINKAIVIDQDSDTVVIKYDFSGQIPDSIYLHPLVAFRSFHHVIRTGSKNFASTKKKNALRISDGRYCIDIVSPGDFYEKRYWYYNFRYPREVERGTNSEEDLYNPGVLVIDRPGNSLEVVITAEENNITFDEALKKYRTFRSVDGDLADLRYNSLSFLMRHDMIAGFHWFGPWGRDTFISMPGVLLVSGRYNEARRVLEHYAERIQDGMIPNTQDVEALRFSADTSLWFIYAVQKYLEYAGDDDFARQMLVPIKSIITAYIKGNSMFHLDDDLVTLTGSPLTWMDAMVSGKPVTPRIGKPIEINALWYNALSFYSRTAHDITGEDTEMFSKLARRIKQKFRAKFIKGDAVLDVSDPDDMKFRPNFLIPYFLPYPLLNDRKFVDLAWEKLVTPYGLRTLSPDDPDYVPTYSGPQPERDMAYHNGTVWPWLAGIFITAAVKTGYDKHALLEKFAPLFSMSRIPEIFDGSGTGIPKGCIMQAWSHGEIARAYFEDLRGGRS